MKSFNSIFRDAETNWRDWVRQNHSLFSSLEIVQQYENRNRMWDFYTDLEKIFVNIASEDEIYKEVEQIRQFFQNKSNEVMTMEMLHYLLLHETFHFIEAPLSSIGKNSDLELIRSAIFKGLLNSSRNLSKKHAIIQTHILQNLILDLIVDVRIALESKDSLFQNNLILAWDCIELMDEKPSNNPFNVLKLLYSRLFSENEHQLDFFSCKCNPPGIQAVEKITQLINETKGSHFNSTSSIGDCNTLLSNLGLVFQSDKRYPFIRNLSSILGEIIPLNDDSEIEKMALSGRWIVSDLLSINTTIKVFLDQIGLPEIRSQNGIDSICTGYQDYNQNNNSETELLILHNYYLNKCKYVEIKKIDKGNTNQSLIGNTLSLKKTQILNRGQISSVNFTQLNQLQIGHGLPVLLKNSAGKYRYNEYEITKSKELRVSTQRDSTLNRIVFFLDASSSMVSKFSNRDNYVNCRDFLFYLVYSLIVATSKLNKYKKHNTEIQINSFAESIESTPWVSVSEFLQGDQEILRTLFTPKLKDGTRIYFSNSEALDNTTYFIVSDGNINNWEKELPNLLKILTKQGCRCIMFELGESSNLRFSRNFSQNIVCYNIPDPSNYFSNEMEILLEN